MAELYGPLRLGPRVYDWRGGSQRAPPRWTPKAGDAVEVLRMEKERRVVIGVAECAVPGMLQWLGPAFVDRFGGACTGRRGAPKLPRRGASIILTWEARSSSGPRCDAEDTLLFVVSGVRRLWVAAPSDVQDRIPRHQEAGGAPVFLASAFDPVLNCASEMVGVCWHGPLTLHAGSAIWIERGWWHCVASRAEDVAVVVEIKHGCVHGHAPRVFEHVAPRKPHGRIYGRFVSRRPGWGSASSVIGLWANVLEKIR